MNKRNATLLLLAFLCLGLIWFWQKGDSAKFQVQPFTLSDGKTGRTLQLDVQQRKTLEELLEKHFGTPTKPVLNVAGIEPAIKEMQLDTNDLAAGRTVYKANCTHCHGEEGSGTGVTAQFIQPKPRDFRLGKFKYLSTVRVDGEGKPSLGLYSYPSREDLQRTIQAGILGAGMPPFRQQGRALDNLVSYVQFLSLRGMAELHLTDNWLNDQEVPTSAALEKYLLLVTKQWGSDQRHPYEPTAKNTWEELVKTSKTHQWKKGEELFQGKGVCVSCHGKDGQAKPLEITSLTEQLDDWGQRNSPRNLKSSILRGGENPRDIFNRIRLGIKPSRMPAADPLTVSDEEVWQMVGYVLFRVRGID